MDSVFSPILQRYADRPLIPTAEIERALDEVEKPIAKTLYNLLERQTEALLRQADRALALRDIGAIASLTWNLGVSLQAPIVQVWRQGFNLGGLQMLQEIEAGIPAQVRREANHYDLAPALAIAVRNALNLERATLDGSPVERAIMARSIRLAGTFSQDQLNRLKADLIGAIVPDGDGAVISRQELQRRIEANLNVGRVRAEMIARTELTNAYNTGRVATALQSSLVTHFRFLAIADARTTEICRSRNGMLIPATDTATLGLNKPPLHVRCRSVLSPVLSTINPTHQDWVNDNSRNPYTRELAPPPKGWLSEAIG